MKFPKVIIPVPNLSNFIILDLDVDKVQHTPALENGVSYLVFTPTSVVTVDPDFLQGYRLDLALDSMSMYLISDPKSGNKARIRFRKLVELNSIPRETLEELNAGLKSGAKFSQTEGDVHSMAVLVDDKAYIYRLSTELEDINLCIKGPLVARMVDGKITIDDDNDANLFKKLDAAISTGLSIDAGGQIMLSECLSILTMEDLIAIGAAALPDKMEDTDSDYLKYLPESVQQHGLEKVRAIFQREHYDTLFRRARKNKNNKEAYEGLPANYQKAVDLWHVLQDERVAIVTNKEMAIGDRDANLNSLMEEYRNSIIALNIPGDY